MTIILKPLRTQIQAFFTAVLGVNYKPLSRSGSGSCYMVFDNIAIEYSQIDRRQAAIIKNRLIFARVEIYQTYYSKLSNSIQPRQKCLGWGADLMADFFVRRLSFRTFLSKRWAE